MTLNYEIYFILCERRLSDCQKEFINQMPFGAVRTAKGRKKSAVADFFFYMILNIKKIKLH